MGISVTCAHCGATLRVNAELAGKRGKCPKCQQPVAVPSLSSTPQPAAAQPVQAVGIKTPDLSDAGRPAALGASATAQQGLPPRASSSQSASSVSASTAKPPQRVARQAVTSPTRATAGNRSAQPESRQAVAADILSSFKGRIAPVNASFTYQLGMLAALVVMILMPVLYIALIVAVTIFVYWYAINAVVLLQHARGRAILLALALYVAPIIGCGILVVFMIKPLFARESHDPSIRALKPEGEPLLFAFIERLCDAVGAPRPKSIEVDCDVNASASFTHGFWSQMTNDLTLRIGLPLAAGLTLQQFAGVLGHEFGHFAQGAGMRVTFMIRAINFWFARVVYHRDEWDQWLIDYSERSDMRIGVIFWVARGLVWLTRKILYGLMMTGHVVCSAMMRQMEYNADLHEIRLVGSGTFISTQRALNFLGLAHQAAYADLNQWYREGRLGDNLPLLTVARMRQLPPAIRQEIIGVSDKRKTGLFDTHPADKDRVSQAQRENATGVFASDRPAADLFSDFGVLCQRSTIDIYRRIFGIKLDLERLHNTEELIQRQNAQGEAAKAGSRYFQGVLQPLRPLIPELVDPPHDPEAAVERLKQLRPKLVAARDDYLAKVNEFDAQVNRIHEAARIYAALEAGFRVDKETKAGMSERRQAAEAEMHALGPKLCAFERGFAMRLLTAVHLLDRRQVANKIDDSAGLAERAESMLDVVRRLDRELNDLCKLSAASSAVDFLLGQFEAGRQLHNYQRVVGERLRAIYEQIIQLQEAFRDTPYPLDANSKLSVAKYLLPDLPAPDDWIAIARSAAALLENFFSLKYRLCMALGEIGQRVETAIGLAPLEDPEAGEEKVASM